MPRVATIGAALFVLGVVGSLAAWLAGTLHPDASHDLEAREALQHLSVALEHELIRSAHQDEFLTAVDSDEPSQEVALLDGDARGADLLAALKVEQGAFAQRFPRVDPQALRLEQFSREPMRYRIAYRGSQATLDEASRAQLALSPGSRFDYRARHHETLWQPYKLPLALLAALVALLGLLLATRGVFTGHLTRQLIAAAAAGGLILTLLLFVAASLQFVDRFSFLGPRFFLENVGMLIMQAIPYTIAFGLLAGVTMVVGRMAAEREDIILQFNGISLRVLAVPVIVASTLFGGVVFVAAHFSEPEGRYQSDLVPYRSLGVLLDRLPSGAYALSDAALPFHFAYERRDGDRFSRVTLVFLERRRELSEREQFRPQLVFLAEQARIEYSEALAEVRFRLSECLALRYDDWPHDRSPRSIYLSTLELRQPIFADDGMLDLGAMQAIHGDNGNGDTDEAAALPSTWIPQTQGRATPSRRTRTMAMSDMQWNLAILQDEARELEAAHHAFQDAQAERVAVHVEVRTSQLERIRNITGESAQALLAQVGAPPAPEPLRERHVQALLQAVESETERRRLSRALDPTLDRLAESEAQPLPLAVDEQEVSLAQGRVAQAQVEWTRRWAVGFAPFAFLFVAVPLGLLLRQGNLLVAFLVTILVVLFVWFSVITWLERAAVDGLVPYWAVAVGPTASCALTGLLLFAVAFRVSLVPRVIRRRRRETEFARMRARLADEAEVRSARLAAIHADLRKPAEPTAMLQPPYSAQASQRRPQPKAPSLWRVWTWPRLIRRGYRRLLWRARWLEAAHERALSLGIGTTFDRYVLRVGLVAVFAAALVVGSLFVSIDYLVNADFFSEAAELRNAEAADADGAVTKLQVAAEYYQVQIPQMLYYLAPLILLVALGFALVRMARANEFLVMHVSGVPVRRVIRPLFLLAVLLGGGMLSYNEWVVPSLAEQMHEEGSHRDPRERVRNRTLVDRDSQALYLQYYDVKRSEIHRGLFVRFGENEPPRIIIAAEARYVPPHGWLAKHWREITWVVEEFEGVRVRTPYTVSAGGKLAQPAEAARASFAFDEPLESHIRTVSDDTDDTQVAPRGVVPSRLMPADVNRRVTQILSDYSISELWHLVRDRPEWNAPEIMLHRAFIYPLGVVILFLIAVPLVLRSAKYGGWYGLAICVLVGMGYFGLLIALTGWALYLQDSPPALILWGGVSPLIVLGVVLYARTPT